MQLIDVKFDNGKGEATVNLEKGVLEIKLNESNSNLANGNGQINISLDPIFEAFIEQAPNLLVKWAEEAAKSEIDGVE